MILSLGGVTRARHSRCRVGQREWAWRVHYRRKFRAEPSRVDGRRLAAITRASERAPANQQPTANRRQASERARKARKARKARRARDRERPLRRRACALDFLLANEPARASALNKQRDSSHLLEARSSQLELACCCQLGVKCSIIWQHSNCAQFARLGDFAAAEYRIKSDAASSGFCWFARLQLAPVGSSWLRLARLCDGLAVVWRRSASFGFVRRRSSLGAEQRDSRLDSTRLDSFDARRSAQFPTKARRFPQEHKTRISLVVKISRSISPFDLFIDSAAVN